MDVTPVQMRLAEELVYAATLGLLDGTLIEGREHVATVVRRNGEGVPVALTVTDLNRDGDEMTYTLAARVEIACCLYRVSDLAATVATRGTRDDLHAWFDLTVQPHDHDREHAYRLTMRGAGNVEGNALDDLELLLLTDAITFDEYADLEAALLEGAAS